MSTVPRVAVNGAGPVGLTLALRLARAGVAVTVLGADPPPQPPSAASSDLRAYSLNRVSEWLLRDVGVWPLLPRAHCQPMRRIVVWEGKSRFELEAAELGVPHLAHIVPHAALLAALWQVARATPGLELLPARLRDWQVRAAGWTLQLHDGQQREVALLVAADGASSGLRQRLRVPVLEWDYGHTAITCRVCGERGHQDTGWQCFLPTGPLALLPLADGACSCIWSTTPEQAQALMTMEDTAFGAALTEASAGVLGALSPQGPRQSFALRAALVRDYSVGRCVLLGDAAHRIHPLAGQGLNQGLKDVAALSQIVLAAAAKGYDLGGARVCRAYVRARWADNALMLAGMEGLKQAFALPWPVLRVLRRLGLTLAHRSLLLKTLLATAAGSLALPASSLPQETTI